MKHLLYCMAIFLQANLAIGKDELIVFLSPIPGLANEDDGNKLTGFFPNIYEFLLKDIGINYSFQFIPIARYNEFSKTGNIDIGIWPKGMNVPNFGNLGHISQIEYGIYRPTDIQEIPGELGCTINNSPFKMEGLNLTFHHSFEKCFELLSKNRVRYVVGLVPAIESIAIKNNISLSYQKIETIDLNLYMHLKYKKYFPYIVSRMTSKELGEQVKQYQLVK